MDRSSRFTDGQSTSAPSRTPKPSARPLAPVVWTLTHRLIVGCGPVSLRMDPDVLAALRATGRGWQSRVNALLRDAVMKGKL